MRKLLRIVLVAVLVAAPLFVSAKPAAAVTLTATTAGAKHVGLATNIWGNGGLASRPIAVQVQVGTRWATINSGRTNASGSYSVPLTYGVTTVGTYRFRSGMKLPSGAVIYSPQVTLRRLPIIVTAATAGVKTVGQPTSIWGTAAGAANRAASVQVVVSGRWVTILTGRTNSAGAYTLPITYGRYSLGTFTYRVVVSTVVGLRYSPNVTLRRAPWNISVNGIGRFQLGANSTNLVSQGYLVYKPEPTCGMDYTATAKMATEYPGMFVQVLGTYLYRVYLRGTSTWYRTPEGAGLGTSETALQQMYGSSIVKLDYWYEYRPGNRSILFVVDGGRVTAIVVLDGNSGESPEPC